LVAIVWRARHRCLLFRVVCHFETADLAAPAKQGTLPKHNHEDFGRLAEGTQAWSP